MKRFLFYALATFFVVVWLTPFLISVFTSLKSMDELMVMRRWWEPPQRTETWQLYYRLDRREYGTLLP